MLSCFFTIRNIHMTEAIKGISSSAYPHGSVFDYPEPLDGVSRAKLDGELKRVLTESQITDYKFLSGIYNVSVGFKDDATKKVFYKAFEKIVSQFSLQTYFIGAFKPRNFKAQEPSPLVIKHNNPEPT